MKRSHRAYDALKRVLDAVGALLALVLLSPVLLVVALLVRIRLGRPVLFRQRRPGRKGELFTLLKFRTMAEPPVGTTTVGAVSSDAERLTALGRTLRATSLDELPELLNILAGRMSFVGPRPLLPEYLDRYNDEQARRHEVRPGLTGWAQINGRNAVPWPERLAMDVWYVDHRSFVLDARIIARTAVAVVRREGVSEPGSDAAGVFDPGASKNMHEEGS